MKIGNTITVKAWGKFEERKMTCISIKNDSLFGDVYVFDNGMELDEISLLSNFNLWASRNGYEIA